MGQFWESSKILRTVALVLVLKLWEISRVTLANSRTQTLPSFSKILKIREREWEFSRVEVSFAIPTTHPPPPVYVVFECPLNEIRLLDTYQWSHDPNRFQETFDKENLFMPFTSKIIRLPKEKRQTLNWTEQREATNLLSKWCYLRFTVVVACQYSMCSISPSFEILLILCTKCLLTIH